MKNICLSFYSFGENHSIAVTCKDLKLRKVVIYLLKVALRRLGTNNANVHLEGGKKKAACTSLTRFDNVALTGDQNFLGKLDLGHSISEDFAQVIL